MRREKAFKEYLEKNKITTKNVGYCRDHIEKAFGGKDMDEIITSHQNISMVRNNLKKIESSDNCINAYMVALNHYLKFAFWYGMAASPLTTGVYSKGGTTNITQGKIDVIDHPLVQYYSDVPIAEKNESFRKALEDEYSKILQFAKNVFSVDYGYIPVYLSKKVPPSKRYKVKKSFLKKLEKKCRAQKEMTDLERCVFESGCFEMGIDAKFFVGEKPYIEIYYKNLPKYNTLEKAINVLAHEYMHFVEYAYCLKNSAPVFVDNRVSEALADFFGVLYSIKRGGKFDLEVAERRYGLWKLLSGSGWPYAYALYFMKKRINKFSPIFAEYDRKGCITKLIEVFNATKNSVDAYDKLIKL